MVGETRKCSKGHLLTEDNIRKSSKSNRERRCLTCFRGYQREYRRKKRATDSEYVKNQRAYARAYQAQRRQDPEFVARQREYQREWGKGRGPRKRSYYVPVVRKPKPVDMTPQKPKVPFEILALWHKSAPNSALRRMFDSPSDLKNKAAYDILSDTVSNEGTQRKEEQEDTWTST
jgi:hypothetical protein